MLSLGAELDCRRAGIVVTGTAVQDLPSACAAAVDALGRYDDRCHVIELLDDAAAVAASDRAPRAFELPMSRAPWQSYVAHEIAHMVLHAQDRSRTLTVAQHEYVAAVVQLSTLPEALRGEILADHADFAAFGKPCEAS